MAASNANAAAVRGGGDELRAGSRRRRIDDVRQMQQQRRRQALELEPSRRREHEREMQVPPPPPPQQQRQPMGGNKHQHGRGGDGNTMASTPSRSAASTSTLSTRRALSAKRQNMMQRRIEMRKRNEERERQQATQKQQEYSRQYYDDHGQVSAHQPQHLHQQPRPQQLNAPQQPQQNQRHHYIHRSILKNSAGNPHLFEGTKHNSFPHYQEGGSQREGQQHHFYDSHSRPLMHGHQQHPREHNFHVQNDPQYDQQQLHQQQQQQVPGDQFYREQFQAQPQRPPIPIPSPPMLQRRQQYSQIPVYHRGEGHFSEEQYNVTGNCHQGVFNREELEQSGIIRNNGPPQANMNRLKAFSPYDSPSDEWHGYSNSQQPVRNHINQHQRPFPALLPRQPQNKQHQQQQPPGQGERTRYHYNNTHEQNRNDVPMDHSYQADGNRSDEYALAKGQDPPNPQQSQHQGPCQNNNQHQQQRIQDQPNWNDINEHYQITHRQRLYQRQMESRQHHHQQQTVPQQNQTGPDNRPLSRLSPVEHLGNRTEQIQRKSGRHFATHSNSIGNQQHAAIQKVQQAGHQQSYQQYQHSTPKQAIQYQHQPQHQPADGHDGEGEGSIVSVSEQARKFEKAAQVQGQSNQRSSSSGRSGTSSRAISSSTPRRAAQSHQKNSSSPGDRSFSNNGDEECTVETVSVASLRKEWEKQPRSKPAPRSALDRNQSKENNPFGIWEARANRLAQLRRREKRKEQRKNIEDRWMRQRQQDGGQAAEKKRSEQYHDGYQSEGPPEGRHGRGQQIRYEDYHDGYQSEGHEELGQEVQYEDTREVETDPITPRDARRRLWDTKERLRASLPKNEITESLGNVQDRWPQHKPSSNSGSPSNYSTYSSSNASGGLFKSKFIHAAALATKNRAGVSQQNQAHTITEEDAAKQPSEQRNVHGVREFEETQQVQVQMQNEHEDKPLRGWQQHHHQRQFDSNAKGKHGQKMAASSHYTDSTAETTDVTTPEGSFTSSHLHGNASRFVRKVSPSPPKRPSAQAPAATMPPIAEAPPQSQTVTSVAELIARINAVSRSNPEEALAAIDSIIKAESGIVGVEDCQKQVDHACRQAVAATATQDIPRRDSGGRPDSQKNALPFSPSRMAVTSSPSKQTTDVVQHLGKDFFQERYEEVLRDSQKVIRGSMEKDKSNDIGKDEEDSLLSSSDESTVSSMTNPTYQSIHSNLPQTHPIRNADLERQTQKQHTDHPIIPKKSWNTLRREFNTRRNMTSPIEYKALANPTSSEDIGIDEFNPDDIEFNPDDIDVDRLDSRTQKHQEQRQPIAKSSTNDFTTGLGICPMSYQVSITQSTSQSRNCKESAPPTPPTPSTLTDNDWVSFGGCGAGNYMGKDRENARSRHPPDPSRPSLRPATKGNQLNKRWPYTNQEALHPKVPTDKNSNLDMPRLTFHNDKNIEKLAASRQQKGNHKSAGIVPKHSLLKTSQPINKNVVPPKRASTPEIMMAVSDAFSNVDISLEEGSSRPLLKNMRATKQSRSPPEIVGGEGDAPPLNHMKSLDSLDEAQGSSLQTISEAFSDVDVSFDDKKTVVQRRKELEYLANTWTKSQSKDSSSSPSLVVGNQNNATRHQPQKNPATAWANQQKDTGTDTASKPAKRTQPVIRVKGNKSLAQKFANLVKAFDD